MEKRRKREKGKERKMEKNGEEGRKGEKNGEGKRRGDGRLPSHCACRALPSERSPSFILFFYYSFSFLKSPPPFSLPFIAFFLFQSPRRLFLCFTSSFLFFKSSPPFILLLALFFLFKNLTVFCSVFCLFSFKKPRFLLISLKPPLFFIFFK